MGFATSSVLGGLVFSLGLLLVAIVWPVTAFVAAGFEHSTANMYFMPLAMPIQQFGPPGAGVPMITWSGMANNLVPVIGGNLVGGSVLVGLTYFAIYRRGAPSNPAPMPTAPRGPTPEK